MALEPFINSEPFTFGVELEIQVVNTHDYDLTRAASDLVRSGRTVSLAADLDKVAGPDNPRPVQHFMTSLGDTSSDEPRFAADFFTRFQQQGVLRHGTSRSWNQLRRPA